MRRLLLLVLLPLFAVAAPAPIDPPPPMPATTVESDVPEVRIIEQKEATITEYRARGKLYKIKVTPKNAPPYYLIDTEGYGRFDRGDNPALENMAVPRWVLFEF